MTDRILLLAAAVIAAGAIFMPAIVGWIAR